MSHHLDLEAALGVFARSAPSAAARAASTLNFLLDETYERSKHSQADHQAAWHFSTLTGDGFPIELAFTTADTHLRYTVDPAVPGLPASQRLENAARLLVLLDQPVEAGWLEELSVLHRTSPPGEVRYGAWIGARHSMADASDQFKLYAEVPASSESLVQERLAARIKVQPRLPDHKMQLRMLGVESGTGRVELYYRVNNLLSVLLSHLLRPAGLHLRTTELLEFVERVYGYSLHGPDARIPGGSVGFSYAVSPGSSQVAFTLFIFARLLWGGDAHIRKRFCQLLDANALDPSPYWSVTAGLANTDVYQTYHGLVGFAVLPDRPIALSLGVRPPPVSAQGYD